VIVSIHTVSRMLQDDTPWPYLAWIFSSWSSTDGMQRGNMLTYVTGWANCHDEWQIQWNSCASLTASGDGERAILSACYDPTGGSHYLRRGRGPRTNTALSHIVVSLVLASGAANLAAVQRQSTSVIDRAVATRRPQCCSNP